MLKHKRDLPLFRGWVLRIAGLILWLGAAGLAYTLRTEVTPGAGVIIGLCLLGGALLLAVPEILRYQLALKSTPPLPGNFDFAMRDVHRAWHELAQEVSSLAESIEQLEERAVAEPYVTTANLTEENYDILLSELRLDLDHFRQCIEPLLQSTDEGAGKELPKDLLGKALKGSGIGKGFPLKS